VPLHLAEHDVADGITILAGMVGEVAP